MKKFYGLVVVVFLLLFATSVFAFGPGGGYGMGPRAIDLSKDQQDKMWQLREKFNSDTSALRYEMFQKRGELRALFANPGATEASILTKEKEVNTLRQKMHDRVVRFKLDQRKIYTPEQIKQLSQRGGYGCGYGQGPRGGGMGMGGRGF